MHFFDFINTLFDTYKYTFTFFFILLAELGVPFPMPFPSESVFLLAGYRIFINKANFFYSILAGSTADFLGSYILYLITYHLQDFKIVKNIIRKFENDKFFSRIENEFRKDTGRVILIGRLIPYIRYYISIVSGVSRVPQKKFVGLSIIASTFWASLLIYIGFKSGPTIFKIINFFETYKLASSLLSIFITASILIYIIKILIRK